MAGILLSVSLLALLNQSKSALVLNGMHHWPLPAGSVLTHLQPQRSLHHSGSLAVDNRQEQFNVADTAPLTPLRSWQSQLHLQQ